MKVNFDSLGVSQTSENNRTISYSGVTEINEVNAGYRLDITKTVMDNTAYGQGKTAEDVAQDTDSMDLRNMHNYVAVMSNSMSAEDYREMKEQGYPPASTDVETAVTIVDKIKATLAESGTVITGYNDDLSLEKLEKITGSAGRADAIAKSFRENDVPMTQENVQAANDAIETGSKLTGINDSTLKYMVQNKKEPTIENLYVASYSTTGETRQGQGYYQEDTPGYYARKATSFDWNHLNPQMQKVIEDAALEVNEDTLSDARFIIEEGIPLDEESLKVASRLRSLELPMSEQELADAVAGAMADGRKPMTAVLSTNGNTLRRAEKILKDTAEITEEALNAVVTGGYTLTLSNLIRMNEELKDGGQNSSSRDQNQDREPLSSDDPSVIRARRQLEECRLHMTLSSNMKLIREGFGVDTRPLEEVVEKLKALELKSDAVLTGSKDEAEIQNRKNLAREVERKKNQIMTMPAAVIGKVITPGSVFTLNYIHVQGSVLESDYKRAGETYEAVGTQVRSDLGDSIRKAFRNVDSILQDMGHEASEVNRRAVRILGYNRMPVNEENLTAVKSADLKVQRVLEKLTPQATLGMIRDGINPLNTDIRELDDYLSEKEDEAAGNFTDMAKYLFKLERNDQITENEREAYIGIYRLMHQIEASDGAVIGQLVNQGAEVNFKNLLSAVRSRKSSDMDVSVDDEYAARTRQRTLVNSISSQIDRGFQEYQESLADDIMDQLQPEKLRQVHIDENTTLEALDQALRNTEENEELNDRYNREELADLRTMRSVEDSVIQKLLDYDLPVNQDNLLALNYLSRYRGATFARLMKSGDEELSDAAEELKEHFDDEESAGEAYEKLAAKAEQVLERESEADGVKAIDIKSLALYSKQLRVATRLAREEDYEVPINMKGGPTSINLRILHGMEETGTVRMTMETIEYGKVEARFTLTQDRVDGYIGYEYTESGEAAQTVLNAFTEELTKVHLQTGEVHAMHSRNLKIDHTVEKEGEKPSTRELYSVAKALIFALETI